MKGNGSLCPGSGVFRCCFVSFVCFNFCFKSREIFFSSLRVTPYKNMETRVGQLCGPGGPWILAPCSHPPWAHGFCVRSHLCTASSTPLAEGL